MPAAPPSLLVRDRLITVLAADADFATTIEGGTLLRYDSQGAYPGVTDPTKPVGAVLLAEGGLTRATLGGRGVGTYDPDFTFAFLIYQPAVNQRADEGAAWDLMKYAEWYLLRALLKNNPDAGSPSLWKDLKHRRTFWELTQNSYRARVVVDIFARRERSPA